MKLYIKYMVGPRCKMKVEEELKRLDIVPVTVELGMVELSSRISLAQRKQLKRNLLTLGFTLLDDRKSILIDKIKLTIMEMIHHTDELPKVNYSDYLSEKLAYDYTYLANVFSETKIMTIQQYIILQKVEKIKKLLMLGNLSLMEISKKMHYSSTAHLSNQFKKTTGYTPIYYKNNIIDQRLND